MDVVEEFDPMKTEDSSSQQSFNNGIATHSVSSIEQGLRKSVTAVS